MKSIMHETLENLGFSVSGISASREMETVEIPNPEKRKPGRYPQKGWTPTVTVTRPKFSKTGERVTIEGTPAAYAALWQSNVEGRLISDAVPALQFNRQMLASFTRGRDEFCGGSSEDLARDLQGKADMTRFMVAKEQVESSDLMERIRRELESVSPRRRRIWSDNGQWVEDRRFEPEAFEDFKRQASPARSINFELQCGENCNVSARKIAEFGATSWAIIDALESAGISVGLRLVYTTQWAFAGNESVIMSCNVKDAGEYVSPSFMAGIMTPNFFRRVIFTAITSAAEAATQPVKESLGSSAYFPDPAEYFEKTSTLRLSSSAIASPNHLADQIIKAIRSVTDQVQAA